MTTPGVFAIQGHILRPIVQGCMGVGVMTGKCGRRLGPGRAALENSTEKHA